MLAGFKEVPGGQTKGYYEIIIRLYSGKNYVDVAENILKLAKCNYELGMI
jgi:hypothetical protein